MILNLFKYKNQISLKSLEVILNKRKSIQKNQTSIVSKIIQNVKKKGDIAVLNYEKKFSRIKTNSPKILFSKKEIDAISKKPIKKLSGLSIQLTKESKNFTLNRNSYLLNLKINTETNFHINIQLLRKSEYMFLEVPQVIQVQY